jgi:hypothetical protein
MNGELTRTLTPEEKEVEQKQIRLSQSAIELAACETELATMKAELATFEHRYLREVGILYAELDSIVAKIAEKLSQQNPADVAAQRQSERNTCYWQER